MGTRQSIRTRFRDPGIAEKDRAARQCGKLGVKTAFLTPYNSSQVTTYQFVLKRLVGLLEVLDLGVELPEPALLAL